jgi:hypothetical protein
MEDQAGTSWIAELLVTVVLIAGGLVLVGLLLVLPVLMGDF